MPKSGNSIVSNGDSISPGGPHLERDHRKSEQLSISDQSQSSEKNREETKFKLIISTLKRFIGVGDMASVRMSLPSQLLEPIGSLEYWTYVDRPDFFLLMSRPKESIDRMLAVLRWLFTKDLKYVRGKVVKPYNSILGEYFRCCWHLKEPKLNKDGTIDPYSSGLGNHEKEITYSYAYKKAEELESKKHRFSLLRSKTTADVLEKPTMDVVDTFFQEKYPHKVVYLCEQTSHHPPVSAFVVYCASEQIRLRGMDQISAKFSGTSIKIVAGEQNKGLFLDLEKHNERYHCTHPLATIGGFFRGNLQICCHDNIYIRCEKTKLKCIIHYHDEQWIGRNKHLFSGVIYKYDNENDKFSDIKQVPANLVQVKLHGSWHGRIYYSKRINNDDFSEDLLLVNVEELFLVNKQVPKDENLGDLESHKIWKDVTRHIKNKEYAKATKSKIEIEEQQRNKIAELKAENKNWEPKFFIPDLLNGVPEMTELGEAKFAEMTSDTWL